LDDELAVSVARVLAAANRRARESGVDLSESFITMTQQSRDDGLIWQVNYGPREFVDRRGGDLIVEVDAGDASVKRVLKGQ
jgi:hypothetical protein